MELIVEEPCNTQIPEMSQIVMSYFMDCNQYLSGFRKSIVDYNRCHTAVLHDQSFDRSWGCAHIRFNTIQVVLIQDDIFKVLESGDP